MFCFLAPAGAEHVIGLQHELCIKQMSVNLIKAICLDVKVGCACLAHKTVTQTLLHFVHVSRVHWKIK